MVVQLAQLAEIHYGFFMDHMWLPDLGYLWPIIHYCIWAKCKCAMWAITGQDRLCYVGLNVLEGRHLNNRCLQNSANHTKTI